MVSLASGFCFASLASLALFPDLLLCPSCSVVCDCFVFLTWVVQVIVYHCCRSWSAQAWKLLGNVHMCPSQCPICAQHVYKLGHSLYTEVTAWPPPVHWSCIHACAQAWARVYISKQFPSLGTTTFTAVYVLSSILSLVFCNQLILYKHALYMRLMFESGHQNFCIGKYLGEGGQWLGMGLLYPWPGYEAIICFTHCKQSNCEWVSE